MLGTSNRFKPGDVVVRVVHRKSAGWFWWEKPVTVKLVTIIGDVTYLEFEEVPGKHPEAYFYSKEDAET